MQVGDDWKWLSIETRSMMRSGGVEKIAIGIVKKAGEEKCR